MFKNYYLNFSILSGTIKEVKYNEMRKIFNAKTYDDTRKSKNECSLLLTNNRNDS